MANRIMRLVVVLVAGGTIGWLLADNWGEAEKSRAPVAAGSAESAVSIEPSGLAPRVIPEESQRLSLIQPRAQAVVPAEKDPHLSDALMQLRTRLDQEAAQRRWLERRVQELGEKLARLENTAPERAARPIATLAATSQPDEMREDPAVRARERTARFLSMGFDAGDEKELTRRMDEIEMERLYLRDQARREGWLRTPQYREAASELRNELRNELGEDGYDRLLYANEQDNRILVDSILESSPAQEIGLQPGDVLFSYDGTRVFSYRDIRRASRRGEAGDPVPLHVERNGEVLELEIPRGPLGVKLGSKSVMP